MRRLPLLPTLLVGLAVAFMLGAGVWQLRRAEWKAGLLADLRRAAAAPPLLIDDGRLPADFAFRKARLRIRCPDQIYHARAGRDGVGRGGWVWQALCRTGAGENVHIVTGWSQSPSYSARWTAPRDALATGLLVPGEPVRARFYLDQPPPTLARAAPPGVDGIPDNHLAYAGQWFFFAAVAAVIYALALRRRHSPSPRP